MTLLPGVGPWPLFQFWSYTKTVEPLGGGSARRKASTYTQGEMSTEWTHIEIHTSNGIRTHDLDIWADEGSLYPWKRGHCDRFVL
jgi:hypothetical protein